MRECPPTHIAAAFLYVQPILAGKTARLIHRTTQVIIKVYQKLEAMRKRSSTTAISTLLVHMFLYVYCICNSLYI